MWHKATSPPHTDGSVTFVRLCQCAPHLIRGWAHPIPYPKRHLDRFSRFCRAQDRDRPTDDATPCKQLAASTYVVLRRGLKPKPSRYVTYSALYRILVSIAAKTNVKVKLKVTKGLPQSVPFVLSTFSIFAEDLDILSIKARHVLTVLGYTTTRLIH